MTFRAPKEHHHSSPYTSADVRGYDRRVSGDESGERRAEAANGQTGAHEASFEHYRQIAAIVEWCNDAIIACDLNGKIISWNGGASRLYGYEEAEVRGRPSQLLVPAALHDQSLEWVARLLGGSPVERHTTLRCCKDGSSVEVSLTLSPIRDARGVFVGYSQIARDLTEQRRAESALKRVEQQLRDAQKMEAVGLLAGGIAHDFNNLLSAIVGYTELVLDSLEPSDPLRADILEVRKAGASAVALTRQLLAFSRRQVLSPRVINLNQVVTHLEHMLRRLLGVRVSMSFELASALGSVSVDPSQVEQVIMNLVLNARDAMSEGGTLTIATENTLLDSAHAELLGIADGKYVRLSISDTGCGVDESTRSRIFEPFFTTKEKGKGTGLGLSTALGIVQQSGGAIEVESTPREGSTFSVYLPCTERPLQSAYSAPPSRVSNRNWETVLLAEDDDQVRNLARTALRRHGYQVLEAEHGERALSICQTYSGQIHLLLTDVVMPNMGGRELAERAVLCRPEMKVVFMSGYASEDILPRGVVEGETELLRKPITPGSLARHVRAALDAL
jgi:PAS domain S-box-containing protein